MMDFNSSASLSGQVAALVDVGMQRVRAAQRKRAYLGASRLGAACERALQYEYADATVDHGRDTGGRMLRVFERGHVVEDCMVAWLRAAGFDLRTRKADGEQFGFSALDGRLQGHVDGVIVAGPDLGQGFGYPALWENKCLGVKSWRDLDKHRLAVAKPVYAAQVALYQAYLELHEHPALFTAVTHHCHIVETGNESWRFLHSSATAKARIRSREQARRKVPSPHPDAGVPR